ncbi:hypothetical protein EII14_01865 [Alloprevotella sp. OH1205_COT-284]|uniref:UvrD-helicase domain-containing protein n=1 Tax=Alloprevotella sp. OH1205_COT-284 TaxID=2491043 RepID=UPI000F5E9825|nr:UvrD-helicase domain-containing protein [Alloprevotella sp. OH1205_COT-284]RRD80560.1 hypothetical protein EII14_01865 [Alloprevotella sp. OH1205_COT-284]
MPERAKLIHVYKASAGAGKTFTLAAEFIANLINDYEAGDAPHRHQLAITFTKKATTEMKERILQYLYELSRDGDFDDGFFQAVRCRVRPHVTDRQIRERAGRSLLQIIHGYDFFHVTTIDSFFQSLLTNLAHELGLSAGFKVDLNDGDVLGKGVDRMLRALRHGSDVLDWVTDYIEERHEADENWNVTSPLKKLSQELLKEPYLIYGDSLRNLPLNNVTVGNYRKTLNVIKKEQQELLSRQARELDDFICQTAGYAAISYGENRGRPFIARFAEWTFKDFNKESQPSATVKDWAENPQKMKKKGDKGNDLDGWYEEVSRRLRLLLETIPAALRQINSCDLSLRHLNPLRLLDVIDREVVEINRENNAFMLAHTPLLFAKMVTGNEASFVFERAGTQFRHVMIDEFQDTSTLQWKNLRNLLVENISQGNSCMLVGDVKQGIYRWRGGDWTALAEIRTDDLTEVKHLDSNFRSGRVIVEFNNRLFVEAAKALSADERETAESSTKGELEMLYAQEEVHQQFRKKGGFVRICVAEKKSGSEERADGAEFSAERELGEQILRLRAAGVPYEEMAILVRRNSEVQRILKYFETDSVLKDIPLVSDEAFLLSSSPAVQTLVHALRYIVRRDDGIAKAYLQKRISEGGVEALQNLFEEWDARQFDNLPFYELVERLIRIFRLHEQTGQTPYLYAFLDAVLVFLDENVADIKRFLEYWDETLHRKSIPSTEVDGVRMLTIHKSKGLAFHSVFLPYCEWAVEQDRADDLLWLHPEVSPFDAIPLLPIPMTARAANSIYEQPYRREHLNRRIENLNLMYVAFTRARQNLIACASPPARSGGKTMRDVLKESLYAPDSTLKPGYGDLSLLETDDCRIVLELGSPSTAYLQEAVQPNSDSVKAKDRNPLHIVPTAESLNFVARKARISFRQSADARRFRASLFEDEEGENTSLSPEAEFRVRQDEARRKGELLHRMMEHIGHAGDLERVVREFVFEGQILEPRQREETIERLRRAMLHPLAAEWFDGSWKLYRECNILSRDATGAYLCQRPDRVMMRGDETVVVDFKFGRSRPAYHRQVRLYCNLLRRMGHKHLRGYVWYVYDGEIEEVELDSC